MAGRLVDPARRRRADAAQRHARGRRAGEPGARGVRRPRRRGAAPARRARPLLRSACSAATAPTLNDGATELRPRLAEILAVLCAAPDGLSADDAVRRPARRRRQRLQRARRGLRGCASCSARGSTRTLSPHLRRRVRRPPRRGPARRRRRCARPPRPTPARCCPRSDAPGRRARARAPRRLAAPGRDDRRGPRRALGLGAHADRRGRPRRPGSGCSPSSSSATRAGRSRAARVGRAAPCSADVTHGWSTGLGMVPARPQMHSIVGSAPHARRCRSRGCSPASPTASGPTRWRRRSARASRPPTTCWPACATRASPSAAPGGVYRLTTLFRETGGRARATAHDLSGVVDDLLARTHKRAYLAVVRAGQLRVVLERGHAGHAQAPGHAPRDRATTRTRWRWARSCSRSSRPTPSSATSPAACKPLHARTRSPTRAALREELRDIRLRGVAAEREEFGKDFCCLAAPILDHRRPLPRRRRHLDVAPRVRQRARRSSRRRCATSSDSKHLRKSAKFLIAVRSRT